MNINLNLLSEKVYKNKRLCLDMAVNAGLGHVTTAFSCAEIVCALYYVIMNVSSVDADNTERDRFIMSKNHGSLMTYPVLADLGYIEKENLMTFMQDGSMVGGHSKIFMNGVDYSGGSLGLGLGVAAGIAYGARLSNKKYHTYVLVGDGECYEGSIWESAMFIGHQNLTNLTVILDRNKMACTDFTENMLKMEPMNDKWKSFNFDVVEIDGHNIEDVVNALLLSKQENRNKPLCIIANTVKGNGIDFMCNNPLMHGAAPRGDKIELAYKELDKEQCL